MSTPYKSDMARQPRRGPLSHGTTLKSLGTFTKAQATSWAKRLDRLVRAEREQGGQRSPEAILTGLGMDDADGREQILLHYERVAK